MFLKSCGVKGIDFLQILRVCEDRERDVRMETEREAYDEG
jgi:hypothetical protein